MCDRYCSMQVIRNWGARLNYTAFKIANIGDVDESIYLDRMGKVAGVKIVWRDESGDLMSRVFIGSIRNSYDKTSISKEEKQFFRRANKTRKRASRQSYA